MTLYKIKALEWKIVDADFSPKWNAYTSFSTYTVEDMEWWNNDDAIWESECTSTEDGKAQAEAHWQSRLMQCLEKVD